MRKTGNPSEFGRLKAPTRSLAADLGAGVGIRASAEEDPPFFDQFVHHGRRKGEAGREAQKFPTLFGVGDAFEINLDDVMM
jgi:hypothetical protein